MYLEQCVQSKHREITNYYINITVAFIASSISDLVLLEGQGLYTNREFCFNNKMFRERGVFYKRGCFGKQLVTVFTVTKSGYSGPTTVSIQTLTLQEDKIGYGVSYESNHYVNVIVSYFPVLGLYALL